MKQISQGRRSLSPNIHGLSQSATLVINDRCRVLAQAGRTIFNLGLGQSPFPVPSPVVEALKRHAHKKDYLPVKGLPELRGAVASFHADKDRIDTNSELVLVGPGSKELMFLLQLVFEGDVVLPTPCWVSYVPQANILGRNVHLLNTTFEQEWRITPGQLERFCASQKGASTSRILVLNYPGNPEGGEYTASELRALAEVCERHELIVLSDEIYGQLNFTGDHVSMARYYPERTIVSSGLSKWCGAGGWRLGTFMFPPELAWLLDAMTSVASETYSSVSAPIQFAAVRAFEGGAEVERYLWHSRRVLSELAAACVGRLRAAGVRVREPQGGFYLFADFEPLREQLARRGITTGRQLCDRLLDDTGVAILPGSAFERSDGELTARLAYVNFDGARALSASEAIPVIERLPASFVSTWCPDVMRAIENIVDWLASES